MSRPDLEISARLRARRLAVRVPPKSKTQPEGGALTIEQLQARSGLPPHMQPAERYEHVVVEKQVRGRLRGPPSQDY